MSRYGPPRHAVGIRDADGSSRSGRTAARRVLVVGAIVLLTAYLAQHVTAPPNATEEGTMLGYVHAVANGKRVYFDFFDYYGPLSYLVPSVFYRLAGQEAFGVRIYLLLVKLATVAGVFVFSRRLTTTWHATCAAVVTTLLVGQRWPLFHIAYPSHLVYPVMLGVWWLMLSHSGHRSVRLGAAGALSGVLLWMKVSQAAFLVAGAFVFLLVFDAPRKTATAIRGRWARIAIVASVVLLFCAFIWEHFSLLYFIYLALPLLGLFAAALAAARRGEAMGAPARHIALFAASVAFVWAGLLLLFFGSEAPVYLAEQVAVLSRVHYVYPFPDLGRPGTLGHFTTLALPLLPIFVTLLFGAWLLSGGSDAPAQDTVPVYGVVILSSFNAFVIYARSDEAHLYYAVIASVPALFVLIAALGRGRQATFRLASLVPIGLCLPLLSVPSPGDFRLDAGKWSGAHLRGLRRHEPGAPRALAGVDPHAADIALNAAIRQIDALRAPGNAVLILGQEELIHFATDTVPVGGRYRHLFYLARGGLLDRPSLDALVPRSVIRDLLRSPPSVLVEDIEQAGLRATLPELATAIRQGGYRLIGKWGALRIYSRNAVGRSIADSGTRL